MDGKEIIQMEALIAENNELKKQLATVCHVDIDNGEEFDWYVLHRLWDLEESLERIIVLSTSPTNPLLSGVAVCAKKALERSRSLK